MAILTLDRVGFAAGGKSILKDIDLNVAPGELVALLGPSGCGKSTLLRLVAGFERPSAGAIALEGRTVAGPGRAVPPEERGVGMVFQSYALWPHMDVAGNVGYGLRALGATARAARVAEALQTVGLGGFERRWVQSLSGGQRQRVALARCLAMKPRILLLDEPLSALDRQLRDTMRTELRNLVKRVGITTIIVTHDQDEAMSMADRIAVMRDGRLEQVGTSRELYTAPKNAFVTGFVGRVNRIRARRTGSGVVLADGTVLGIPTSADTLPARCDGVEVMVRAEAIRLALGEDDGLPAKVGDRIFFGDRVEVHLVLPDGQVLRAEVADREAGRFDTSDVRISLDASGCFVFPDSNAS